MPKIAWDYETTVSAEVRIDARRSRTEPGALPGIMLLVDSGVSSAEFYLEDSPAQRSALFRTLASPDPRCVVELRASVAGSPAVRFGTFESPVSGEREIEVRQGSEFANVYVPRDRMESLCMAVAEELGV